MGQDTMFETTFFLSLNLYSKVVLPEFPEDAYPDVPEMDLLKEEIKSFDLNWKNLEAVINDSFFPIFKLEIAGQTPEELLQKAVEIMESKGCDPNICCQEWVILKALRNFRVFLDGLDIQHI